jgi:hypothetical protein
VPQHSPEAESVALREAYITSVIRTMLVDFIDPVVSSFVSHDLNNYLDADLAL